MFEPNLELSIQASQREAESRRHEFVCVEHLLFALLHNDDARKVIKGCGGNISKIKKALSEFFDNTMERMPPHVDYTLRAGAGYERVLNRAILHYYESSSKVITAGDLLAAIFTETKSHAAYILQKNGVSRLNVLEFISHKNLEETLDSSVLHSEDSYGDDSYSEGVYGEDSDDDSFAHTKKNANTRSDAAKNPLESYTRNLTQEAKDGEIDPLIGRELELNRIIHVLSRRNKSNPLLVGDQGVGKTAVIEGLAKRVVAGELPSSLKNLQIYALDLGGLLAGTRYRGDFEQRLKSVVRALENIESAVLFIDEIHTIIGAGATSGGTLDAANILKPVLTRGKIKCIGSTTYEEYKNHFEKDRALARRFSKIEICEPSIEQTVDILKGLKQKFEEHHRVNYTDQALSSAVELSYKYINERFLPDKAIDVIDEAGAHVRMQIVDAEKVPIVETSDIETTVAQMAKIPSRTVSASDRDKLLRLDEELKQIVFGQNEAIDELCMSIRRARAGLTQERKPIGSFLFAGPTGVGKTEVAKQLASFMGLELIRFDMSEYMEKHTVARLIGAPPGYVGYDHGGLLTDSIIRTPHAVLLLDEIEKAHPDLFNILLQVMDNATLTDSTGRRADFRNVVLIMTTNIGSEALYGQAIGFSNEPQQANMGALLKHFRPEFRNRLTKVVSFKPLQGEIIGRVVDKFVAEIDSQLKAKNANIVLSTEARAWIADKGYSPEFGARSLYRLIQKQIADPLADALLFGNLTSGGVAFVELGKDKLEIRCESCAVQSNP